MTGRIDITCSLPAPTLAQVRAWLTRSGWYHYERGAVAIPGSVVPSFCGWVHERLPAIEDAELEHGEWIARVAMASIRHTPESVYREIVGPPKVWLVTGFGRDGSQAFAVVCLSEETANRIACDHVSGPENMNTYSIEERDVRT